MIKTTIETRLAYGIQGPCHFRLHVAAMRGPEQHVASESLEARLIDGAPISVREFTDDAGNRLHRFDAPPGDLRVNYRAVVERTLPSQLPDAVEYAISDLPDEMLDWLTPTRFCESDRLAPFAVQTFGNQPPGLAKVGAVVAWIRGNIEYRLGSSTATTSAFEVFEQRAGVCRDFAHLAIALCRALNIPSRFVVGYVIFDDPPQDFHAIFEVWLGRWIMLDPTGMAPTDHFIRVGVGSDAKGVAFATTFGSVALTGMEIDLFEEDAVTGQSRRGSDTSYVMPLPPVVRTSPA